MDTSFLFHITIDVNWTKFWIFASLVIANFLYSIFTFYYKKSDKFIFRLIGWALALGLIAFFLYVECTDRYVLDFDSYEYYYYTNYNSGQDVFYYKIGIWMNNEGYSYETYRGLLYGFSYLFLWITLSVYKTNKNFVLSIFAVFLWYACAMLVRNWLGFSIVLLALCFLRLKGVWKYVIGLPCFVLLIYCAYQFHASCGFYSVFILCFFDFKGKNYVLRLGFIAAVVFLISLLYDNKLLEKVFSNIPMIYNNLWVYHDRSEARPILEEWQIIMGVSFYYLLSAGVIYLTHVESTKIYPELEIDYVSGYREISKKESDALKSSNLLVAFCVCMFILLPFFSANFNFYRLLRFGSIFLIMGLPQVIKRSKLKLLSPFNTMGFFFYIYGTIWLLTYLNIWEVGGYEGAWNYLFWILFK